MLLHAGGRHHKGQTRTGLHTRWLQVVGDVGGEHTHEVWVLRCVTWFNQQAAGVLVVMSTL